jgi:hypothetical protein
MHRKRTRHNNGVPWSPPLDTEFLEIGSPNGTCVIQICLISWVHPRGSPQSTIRGTVETLQEEIEPDIVSVPLGG